MKTLKGLLAWFGVPLFVWLPLLIVLAVHACGCAVTPQSAMRREAEGRLRGCMSGTRCMQERECVAESAAWCRAHGLEASCGTDAIFTDPIRGCR